MHPVFIVDSEDKQAKLEAVLGDSITVLNTNGLLYDLPTNVVGVDIMNDFKLSLKPRPDAADTIRKLRLYHAQPVLVVTSPNEQGERLYHQVCALLKLNPTDKFHFAPHSFDVNTIQNYFANRSSLNANLYDTATVRRTIERLGGAMFSEFCYMLKTKRKESYPHSLSHASAIILAEVFRTVERVSVEDPYRLEITSVSGLTAHEIQFVKGIPLQSFKPKQFDSEFDAKLDLQALKQLAPDLEFIKKEDADELLPPAPPLTLARLSLLAFQKLKLPLSIIEAQLDALFSRGYVSYYGLHKKLDLIQKTRTAFAQVGAEELFDESHFAFANNLVFPLLITSDTLPADLVPLHKLICDNFLDSLRLPVRLNIRYTLLRMGRHHFLNKHYVSTTPSAPFVKLPNKTFGFDPKDSFAIQCAPVNKDPVHGINLEHLLSQVKLKDSHFSLLRAAQQLILKSKHLTLSESGELQLTATGYILGGWIAKCYKTHASFEALKFEEVQFAKILSGQENRLLILHEWYQRFRVGHEMALKVLTTHQHD